MRVPLALILIAVFVAAATFVANHPGQVEITWQGWQVETSVGVLGVAVLILLAVLGMLGTVVRGLLRLPRAWRRRRRERRRRAGYAALANGFAAIAAGDPNEARRAARRATALLDDVPLALALSAQAASLDGDAEAAQAYLAGLVDRPETMLLGLRGLYIEAMRTGDRAAALDLALRAHRLRPNLAWAVEGVLALQLRLGRWEEARDTLAEAARRRVVPPERARRQRSAILVELSRTTEQHGDQRQAVALAGQAAKLTPEQAAPFCREASLLVAMGRTRAARRVIERAWQTAPHPELARLYAGLDPDAAPLARLEAVQALAARNPDAEESRIAVAEAALDAKLWGEARRHLGRALEAAPAEAPSRRLCRLMARLEESERGDTAAGRQWLDRAVSAPPDPRYVCTACSAESVEWHALCPSCGSFDTLAWRAGAAPPLAPHAAPAPLLPSPSDLAAARQ
ncbi:MAG TPA: heme biosynthesis HemY N-terminal domain-containing protein [Stellaceae bacterium]|nr:heme biosynthesis HemY N-terminal domain-containing protein [Stellaceae bacterium]